MDRGDLGDHSVGVGVGVDEEDKSQTLPKASVDSRLGDIGFKRGENAVELLW